MKSALQLIVGLTLLLLSYTAQAMLCAQVKQKSGGRWRDSSQQVVLYAGEILPVHSVNPDKSRYSLDLGSRIVIVSSKVIDVLKEGDVTCAPRPLQIARETPGYGGVAAASPVDKKVLKAGEIVQMLSEARDRKNNIWARVELVNKEIFWINQSPVAKPESFVKSLRFGFDIGAVFNGDSHGYDNLLTNVPDATNVGALQDPIVTAVAKGKGFSARGFAEYLAYEILRLQLSLGYIRQAFQYTVRANPTTSAVTLDQLQSSTREAALEQLQTGVGASLQHLVGPTVLSYGLQGNWLYRLSDEVRIPILTGSVFKATAGEVRGGPAANVFQVQLRLEARWQGYIVHTTLAPSGEMALGLGYVF